MFLLIFSFYSFFLSIITFSRTNKRRSRGWKWLLFNYK